MADIKLSTAEKVAKEIAPSFTILCLDIDPIKEIVTLTYNNHKKKYLSCEEYNKLQVLAKA